MKKRFITTILICSTTLLLFSFRTSISKKDNNLLKNGDYESGNDPWNPWWGLTVDNSVFHSGKASGRIDGEAENWRGSNVELQIPQKAKKIKITGWMKTENIKSAKETEKWQNAKFLLEFKDSADKSIENIPAVAELVGTNEWKQYTRTYTIPKNAAKMGVVTIIGQASGKAWFDDIVIQAK